MARIGKLLCVLAFALGGCVVPPAVLPSMCGDGIVSESAGEECDDQGVSATCDIDCTLAVCGDGMVNAVAGEECDTAGGSASCDGDCTVARCGDGLINPAAGESCDDGNVVAGDGCNADCRTSGICGNGTLDTGEACDDGNATDGDDCSASCRLESCGNGTLEPGETCDYGGVSTATCNSNGTPVTCGDGLMNPMAGEQCDDAGMSATCNHDCTVVWCGDGVVNPMAGEQCDTAGESAFCDADCTAVWCGDGVVNAMAGEECDDGNPTDGDGCSSACLIESACAGGSACTGLHLWSRGFGSDAGGEDLAIDNAGNVLLTGVFHGTVDFGGGPLSSAGSSDFFVVKLDAQGQHLWSRRFGGASYEYPSSIAVDSAGNVLITGYFPGTADFGGGPLSSAGYHDIFVVKLDAQGQYLWSRRFGGTGYDSPSDIVVDSASNAVIVGSFGGTVDFGGGPLASAGSSDIFVVKLDAQGQHLWSRRFGGADNEYVNGIAMDSADNPLLTGGLRGTVDFGGGPLSSSGGLGIFVVKLNDQGQHLWSRRYGAGWGLGHDLAVDSAGNVLLTGSFNETLDFGGCPLINANNNYAVFVAKLDAQGQHLWSRSFNDDSEDGAFSGGIAVDSSDSVLVTGSFYGTIELGGGSLSNAGISDGFVVRLNARGQHVWSHRFGGADEEHSQAIAVDSTGNVLLTGQFEDAADFGGAPLTTDDYGVFVLKLAP
jgi:cysteine-rich repeat protein